MAEQEFKSKAADVAAMFDISEAAAYRLAREKRLPAGSFAYLNARTVRFDLPAVRQWLMEGGASVPPKKASDEKAD